MQSVFENFVTVQLAELLQNFLRATSLFPAYKIIQKENKKIHFFFDRIFYYKGTSFMNETKRCISKSKNHIQTDKT